MDQIIMEIQQGLVDGDAEYVKDKTEAALGLEIGPEAIIKKALIPTMNKIGQEFREGEIYIPDVLMSSRAMHASLYVLKPLLTKAMSHHKGKVVIGTVAGDLHDIGKNMVIWSLQGEGYEVIDLGIDVPPASFVAAIRKCQPDILAMSALLTTTIGEMRNVIQEVTDEGLRDKVKIIVGGGPVTQDFADEVGANGYGKDIFGAIDVVNHILSRGSGYFGTSEV